MMINDNILTRKIEEALQEDIGLGDITTEAIVPPHIFGKAVIIAKEEGIIAGVEVASIVFKLVDPNLQFNTIQKDGSIVLDKTLIAEVKGSTASILKAERTALNFIQRMSGIATITNKFVKAVNGTRAKITDTRKTAPSLRVFDKMAVRIGGGVNHRFGLDDMILIKDNHITAVGGITPAFYKCREYLQNRKLSLKIEIETKNLDEVREVLKLTGVDRIMLDNFSLEMMREAVNIINNRIEVEASGNVSLSNVRQIAETGVDFISIGAITHSVKALDVSLELKGY